MLWCPFVGLNSENTKLQEFKNNSDKSYTPSYEPVRLPCPTGGYGVYAGGGKETTAPPRPASTTSLTCSSIVLPSVGENTKVSTELVRLLDLGSGKIAMLMPVLLNGLTCTGVSLRRDCEAYHGIRGFNQVTRRVRYLLEYHGHCGREEVALFP